MHEEMGSVSYDWGIIKRERNRVEEQEFNREITCEGPEA